GRGARHRHDLADDADARAALHPAARQDSGPRRAGAAIAVALTNLTREELQRIIDLVGEEMAGGGTTRPLARCRCHAVLDDCCPDRLRGVLDAGATRVGVHATGGGPGGVAGVVDHTLLTP